MKMSLVCAVVLGLLVARVLGQFRGRERNWNDNFARNGGVQNVPNNLNPTENAFRNERGWNRGRDRNLFRNNPNAFGEVPTCLAPRAQCGPIQLVQRECCQGNCRRGTCP